MRRATLQQAKPSYVVDKYMDDILTILYDLDVLTVAAPPGTGKSLGIPAFLASRGMRVAVSVPAGLTARSLADRSSNANPELNVGYVTKTRSQYQKVEDIVYFDSEQLLSILSSGQGGQGDQGQEEGQGQSGSYHCNFNVADVIIIDDAHVPDLHNYFIGCWWRYCHDKGASGEGDHILPKLLLVSSAPSTLTTPTSTLTTIMANTDVYQISTNSYPVEHRYYHQDVEDGLSMIKNITGIMVDLKGNIDGDVLIIMSGPESVKSLIQSLIDIGIDENVIVPVSDESSFRQVNRMFSPGSKIIVGTSLVTNSLTTDNLAVVIDSMYDIKWLKSFAGGPRHVKTTINRGDAVIRSSLVGRKAPGLCYRMMTRKKYDRLKSFTVAEQLQQQSLKKFVIKAMLMKIDPVKLFVELDANIIGNMATEIQALKVLDHADVRRYVEELPLNVRNSVCLWIWITRGHDMLTGIIVMSLLDSYGSFFVWPQYNYRDNGKDNVDMGIPAMKTGKEEENSRGEGEGRKSYQIVMDEHRSDYFSQFVGVDDLDTYINIWNSVVSGVGTEVSELLTGMEEWGITHSIDHHKLSEVVTVVNKCIDVVRRLGSKTVDISIGTKMIQLDNTTKMLAYPIIERIYDDKMLTLETSTGPVTRYKDESGHRYSIDNYQAINLINITRPQNIIAVGMANVYTASVSFDMVTMTVVSPQAKYQYDPVKLLKQIR
jgi:hypothetical protein